MSPVDYTDPGLDDFDTRCLMRLEAKRDEYRARSHNDTRPHVAICYRERANGMDRAIGIYQAELKGFHDTLPTGNAPI